MGLTGGSWELGVISLCYFIIITLEKPKLTKLIIYFLLHSFKFRGTGTDEFGWFVVANLFFLKALLKKRLSDLIIFYFNIFFNFFFYRFLKM